MPRVAICIWHTYVYVCICMLYICYAIHMLYMYVYVCCRVLPCVYGIHMPRVAICIWHTYVCICMHMYASRRHARQATAAAHAHAQATLYLSDLNRSVSYTVRVFVLSVLCPYDLLVYVDPLSYVYECLCV